MVFSTKFSLPSFLRQVNKLTESQRNSIIRVGFGNLLHMPNHFLRRSQLIEMMERWNSEKQAFVFPHGEITITLLDVVLILGLRVIGEPVVLEEDAPMSSLEKEFGASVLNRTISLESLKEKLESLGERDDESFVQVFLLYCFGTLLFPSANGKVDSRYLSILQELDNVSCYAWGAAVHQDLLDSLSQRKVKKRSNISGCLILLQIWCYEHIMIGRPKLLDCPSTFPRVCQWESSSRHYLTSSQFTIKFEELEHTQILWRLQPTSEEIQIDIIREIPLEWYSSTGLGTMEQLDLESENTDRMVRAQREEDEEQQSISKSGCGMMAEQIDIESERDSNMVGVQLEGGGEEPTRQEKSMIIVSSDVIIEDQRNNKEVLKRVHDENEEEPIRKMMEEKPRNERMCGSCLCEDYESKAIKDLEKENLESKVIIEELRKENEELRKLVEKLRSEGMLMDNFVSNLERIVLDDNVDL